MTRRLLLPIAVFAAACGADAPAPAADTGTPIPVRVASPTPRSTEPDIVLTGVLGAREEVPLGFKIGGVVAEVRADVGDRVAAGQLLAALSLTEIEASVSAAREARDKARRDVARVESLARDSVATQSQLDDARTGLEVAEAQLRAAEFNRQYAEVRAPGAGVVLRRQVDPGQLIGPGQPVFVVRVEGSGLVLRAGAADREAVRLVEGMAARVSFDAYPDVAFSGRIARVGVGATPMTGTYETEIAVDAAGRRLASGLVGRARITPRSAQATLTIPAEALLEVDGREATVFVLGADGASVSRRRIRVLWLDGPVAGVAGEVTTSDRIVTAGATRLTDGSRVTVSGERVP